MARNQRRRTSTTKNKSIINFLILFFSIILVFLILAIIKMPSDNNSVFSYKNTDSSLIDDSSNLQEEQKEDEPVVVVPEDITINMGVIGDIMCHNSQYTDAYNSSTGEYDFSYVFEDIKYYIQTADVAIGNVETTFAGKERGYSNYPTFNTPEALAYNLKSLGVDVVSTANNHSLDKGYSGLESTIDFLDDADIAHTGTFKSEEEKNTILIKNVKGLDVAFLSYTYGTNGIPVPSGKNYCINLIDKDLMSKHLELAKQKNPDLICVIMHWGVEYATKQNSTQEDLANFLFENGADIILGGHPHVLQPMEKRTITLADGSTKEGFVIYSLGNFISGQTKTNTRNSIILDLQITKDGETGKITVDKATYTPIYMYKKSSGTQKYKLLDIEKSINLYEQGVDTSIGQTTYNTLKTELEKIKKIVGEEIL